MSYAYQRDANEAQIVEALRGAGCVVRRLNGSGIPDLLVSRPGSQQNHLLEVKDPNAPRWRGRKKNPQNLTDAQLKFMAEWHGQVAVVTTPAEALAVVNA